MGLGVVRSLDGENTDPLANNVTLSTPGQHLGASNSSTNATSAIPVTPSATRRMTRSAAATSSSVGERASNPGTSIGGEDISGGMSNATSNSNNSNMEEELPPHKKKPHLVQQQSSTANTCWLGARQLNNWQISGSSSPRILDQAVVAAETSEVCMLLRQLAKAYKHLCMYRSHEAIQALNELPKCQYNTGWVLAQVATVPSRQ